MRTIIYIFISTAINVVSVSLAYASCTKNVRYNLPLRAEPNASSSTIVNIPRGSCRFAVETTSCTSGRNRWCKAAYDGKFGWVNTAFTDVEFKNRRHEFNYFILKAIYERVSKRSGRGYNISKSYSQGLDYGRKKEEIKRFYYRGGFKYPGGNGETMCVAAVAEVMVEALNVYQVETGDRSFETRLPSDHWKARAKARHLRQHLWEYDGLGSKGAGHALERFNIGEQKRIEHLTPGDTLKFNRANGGPGHSTIFIGYVNKRGETLEKYSKHVAGFLYFSAQGTGFDASGKPTNGLSFRQEYFTHSCPANANKLHCRVFKSGRYGPNFGRMYHPSSWGKVGKNYRIELANERHLAKTGKPLPRKKISFINSPNGSWLKREVDSLLEREMDPSYEGFFSTKDD